MNGIVNLKLVALDSNLFIYYFENNPDFAPSSVKIFERLSSGTLKAVTSVISVMETLSYPTPPQIIETMQEAFESIPNLNIIDVDYKIVLEAARIRREYKFRLPDAIQLATAVNNKAQAFVTNDKRLASFIQLPIVSLD